jgi:hypothetical protein
MSGFQRAQTIYDAISGRRSIRQYSSDDVSPDTVPSPDHHGGHGAVGSQPAAMALRRGPGREPDAANATAYFECALAVARQQHGKSWELRAATRRPIP